MDPSGGRGGGGRVQIIMGLGDRVGARGVDTYRFLPPSSQIGSCAYISTLLATNV